MHRTCTRARAHTHMQADFALANIYTCVCIYPIWPIRGVLQRMLLSLPIFSEHLWIAWELRLNPEILTYAQLGEIGALSHRGKMSH